MPNCLRALKHLARLASPPNFLPLKIQNSTPRNESSIVIYFTLWVLPFDSLWYTFMYYAPLLEHFEVLSWRHCQVLFEWAGTIFRMHATRQYCSVWMLYLLSNTRYEYVPYNPRLHPVFMAVSPQTGNSERVRPLRLLSPTLRPKGREWRKHLVCSQWLPISLISLYSPHSLLKRKCRDCLIRSLHEDLLSAGCIYHTNPISLSQLQRSYQKDLLT